MLLYAILIQKMICVAVLYIEHALTALLCCILRMICVAVLYIEDALCCYVVY